MRELESKYSSDLVVIGVHSGKYHAERITSRITDAAIRLGAIHPVVNDRQFRVWRSFAASAWPTLVAIDPSGYVVGAHAGEFTAEALMSFVEVVIGNARTQGTLKSGPLHLDADAPTMKPGDLRYPGRVAIDGDRIAIADSGNHRVLVGRLMEKSTAKIEHITGSGEPGLEDGSAARFNSPQGLAFSGNRLYVADSENHAIREIEISTGVVKTIAGTGSQLRTRADQLAGAMSSPWDVTLSGETLFVAMAGTHQLWSVDTVTGRSRVHSGMGGEDIQDGDNSSALLAQPMGITAIGSRLYFADSESNAIRWAEMSEDGSVGTIVGTGLFDFGDVDGAGDDVRLQHPQGLTLNPGGGLLVADSYNDCIKLVDPASRVSATWLRGFHEPGGISCSGTHAYVADTNAHRIAVVSLETKEVADLRIE
ncbi:MAG: alkyl hydroperoxide reductase [Gemmatimonadales bacterium]